MVDPITGPMSTFEYNFHCEKHKVKLENYFNSESLTQIEFPANGIGYGNAIHCRANLLFFHIR